MVAKNKVDMISVSYKIFNDICEEARKLKKDSSNNSDICPMVTYKADDKLFENFSVEDFQSLFWILNGNDFEVRYDISQEGFDVIGPPLSMTE